MRLRRAQRRDGSFGRLVNLTSYGILALRAQGVSPRARSVRRAAGWLARRQNRDGGFSFSGAGAERHRRHRRRAHGARGRARAAATCGSRRAAAWLARRQNLDGGYALQPPGRSNAQSAALAVQGLVAAGRNPDRQRRSGARSPIAFLRTLQVPGGLVRYSRTSAQTPVWVTAQALAALRAAAAAGGAAAAVGPRAPADVRAPR